MNTHRPTPGSPWSKHCPDAYPIEWFDADGLTELPPGFNRFATEEEAALITGRVTPDEFNRARAAPHAPAARTKARPRVNRSAVGQRFRDLSEFLRGPHRELTPTERAVWLCVYAFSANGRATVTQTKMAEYCGVTTRAVKSAVKQLERSGLLVVLERGRPGRSSVYRYRVLAPA